MDNSSQFKKRLKSFLWRSAMMGLAGLVDFAAENLGLFNLSPQMVLLIGVLLGEVSKWLNNLLGSPK